MTYVTVKLQSTGNQRPSHSDQMLLGLLNPRFTFFTFYSGRHTNPPCHWQFLSKTTLTLPKCPLHKTCNSKHNYVKQFPDSGWMLRSGRGVFLHHFVDILCQVFIYCSHQQKCDLNNNLYLNWKFQYGTYKQCSLWKLACDWSRVWSHHLIWDATHMLAHQDHAGFGWLTQPTKKTLTSIGNTAWAC